jgi:hypothetical protein
MNVGMKRDTLEIVSAESLEYELDGACASGWFTPRDVWPLIAYLAGQPGGRIFLRTDCEPAAARRRSGKLLRPARCGSSQRSPVFLRVAGDVQAVADPVGMERLTATGQIANFGGRIPGVIEQQRAYRRPSGISASSCPSDGGPGSPRYHKSRTEPVMGDGASIRGEAGR